MTKPSDWAFPLPPSTLQYEHYGLTKREYFAAIALQGLLASGAEDNDVHETREGIAQLAVEYADTLVDALNALAT